MRFQNVMTHEVTIAMLQDPGSAGKPDESETRAGHDVKVLPVSGDKDTGKPAPPR
ncbi:hypothetical protein [Mesorhizobium sp. M0208]|uniref:hypothetical protein n=1 Tax=Mesorhizobium sp. M0208 TaxID=2956916 RepID=UPI0033357ADF